MANILTMRRLLGFKDFFPNEIPHSKEFYASKVGRDIIEKSTSFFLSFLRHKGTPPVDNLLQDWFTFYNFKYFQSPSYWQMHDDYKRIKNHHIGEQHSIISVESLLNMFLWVKKITRIPDDIDMHDASVTLRFFELVLLFNDDILENYEKATKSTEKFGTDRKLQRIILSGSFSQSDLVNIDYAQLFYTQIYKKAKLLEYIEREDKYSSLLSRLLKDFGCSSKEEFLKAIGSAVIIPLKTYEPSWSVLTIANSIDKEKSTQILENLAIDETENFKIEQNDYLSLRSKPFQKVADGEYRVIFELFLIKKLYNGLIFKLSSYDKNFLGNIRYDFSEKVLVYDTLTSILKFNGAINITGEQFTTLKREPDFYHRNENDIILFESKDFFIPGKIKLSYDFNLIETELKKDGRFKKAVIQLAKNIERCLLKQIPSDTSYIPNDINIHPVIIVHDSLYSAPALNYWIHYWFIDEIENFKSNPKLKNFDLSKITSLTIIEIDTLILYQEQFIRKKIDLADLIKKYHQYVRFDLGGKVAQQDIESHALKSAISFSEFVRDYALTLGIKIDFKIITKMLKKYGIN